MDDLAKRLANRVQLTSDGHKAYLEAVEGAFGADIDYAQLVKLYGEAPEAMKGKYSPAECIGTRKTTAGAVLRRTVVIIGGALVLLLPWSAELFRAGSPLGGGGGDGARTMTDILALSAGPVVVGWNPSA